ncbi:MAG: DinB family protein [Sediminibacterium sp.]|nr:DinB family protein [Sediminibacterium sp.]
MNVSFKYLIVGLLLNFSVLAQKNDSLFLIAAVAKMQHAKEYSIKVANLMPEEKYLFQPINGEMSFGEQLVHLSQNIGWLCTSYLGGLENPVKKTDLKVWKKEEIVTVLNSTYDYAIYTLQHLAPARLSDKVSFFAGPLNKLQIVNLLNDHQTHHRAQILVYLRLNGIKPPDYIGW